MVDLGQVIKFETLVRRLEKVATELRQSIPSLPPSAGQPDGTELRGGTAPPQTSQAVATKDSEAPEDEEIDLVYPDVESFVAEEFATIYIRPIGAQWRWCAEWWRHVEAVSRFEALWRAWERLRLDPGFGIAVWNRDYLDVTLPILQGPTGPFWDCTPEAHVQPQPLRVMPAPPGFWDWLPPEDGDPSPRMSE